MISKPGRHNWDSGVEQRQYKSAAEGGGVLPKLQYFVNGVCPCPNIWYLLGTAYR